MSEGILERRRAALLGIQREHIVEGFAIAAMENGYAGATIADIVRIAHVSKSTFYEHFAGKEAVYLHLHGLVADAHEAAFTESVQRTADERDWRERVRDVMRARVELMATHPLYLAQVRIEPQVATDGAMQARRGAGERFTKLYAGFSDDLAKASPEVAPLPAPIALAGLGGGLALIARAADHGPQAVRDLEGTLTDLWIRLLRA